MSLLVYQQGITNSYIVCGKVNEKILKSTFEFPELRTINHCIIMVKVLWCYLMPQVRVLLVDDQEDILRVMQLILARCENYCVETAASGNLALEKAETFAPDVVISDISMPEMDGCEMM